MKGGGRHGTSSRGRTGWAHLRACGQLRGIGGTPETASRSAAGDLETLARDLEFLVRRHDEHGHCGVVGGDGADAARGRRIALRIDAHARESEGRESLFAHGRRILADTGCEDDDVDAAELGEVGAGVGAQAVDVDLERARRGLVPRSTPAWMSRMSEAPARPSRPLRLFSRVSRSSVDSPTRRDRCRSTAGSRSPERVPITSPSSGVSPIEVSIERPPSIAATEAPFPRWKTIWRSCSRGRSRKSAAASLTNLCDVPWNPYRRTRCAAASSASIAYVYAAAGRVWWNAVSNTATCGTSGKAFFAAVIPWRFAGLCSGASTDSSSMLISTSGVMRVGSKNRAPPCTTRWPTAIGGSSSSDGPCSAKARIIRSKPAVWSGMRSVRVEVALRTAGAGPSSAKKKTVCVAEPDSSPMRSTSPAASTFSAAMSISWYLNDDEPLLMTRTGVISLPLRLNGRDRDGVDDVLHEGTAREVVDRLLQSLQHRADRDGAGRALHRLIGVVAGVEVGEDEDRGPAGDLRPRELGGSHGRIGGGVVLNRSLHEQFRGTLAHEGGGGGT